MHAFFLLESSVPAPCSRRALVSRHARVQVRFLDQAQGLVPAWREMTQEKQLAELQRLEVQKLQVQRETELARQVTWFACRATNHIVRTADSSPYFSAARFPQAFEESQTVNKFIEQKVCALARAHTMSPFIHALAVGRGTPQRQELQFLEMVSRHQQFEQQLAAEGLSHQSRAVQQQIVQEAVRMQDDSRDRLSQHNTNSERVTKGASIVCALADDTIVGDARLSDRGTPASS